jgi:hypothetical protein
MSDDQNKSRMLLICRYCFDIAWVDSFKESHSREWFTCDKCETPDNS